MVNKHKIISEIEKLLQKVSVDYYLWTSENSPKKHSKSSVISASSAEERINRIIKNKGIEKKKKGLKNSCPKPRRPNKGVCKNPEYSFIYKNKNGNDCCYKKAPSIAKTKAIKTSCPVPRRPVNGLCKTSKYPFLRKNKNGDDCCFVKEF